MPPKPTPDKATAPKTEPKRGPAPSAELSETELDYVSGGKLPGKRKPPTVTL
jgi:hypothetical protein